jgi:predicted glutamine amidotransferase
MLAYSGGLDDTNDVLREFRILVDKGNVPRGAPPGHKDGWGITCYADGTLKELRRQPTNAITDELYVTASNEAARIKPKILIAHLRKASPGIGISLENTQPLRRDSWSFAHNGTVWSPSFRRKNGQSDSIVFFEKLLESIQSKSDSGKMHERIANSVMQLRKSILDNPDSNGKTYTSITFILSDGKSLYVLRDFNEEQDENYYTMYYLQSTDCVLFCQQQITPGDWKSLDNRSMAAVGPKKDLEIVRCQ